MLIVTISEKGAPATSTNFDKSEVTIGRVKGNDIVLPKTNVSKRHARIVVKDGKTILIDLKSTNGTYVNGRKITNPQVLTESDKVFIGDFTLDVKETHVGEEARPMGAGSIPLPTFGSAGPSVGNLPPTGGLDAGVAELKGPSTHGDVHGAGSMPSYAGSMPSLGATPSVTSFPAGPGPKSMGAPPSLAGPGAAPSLGPAGHQASAPSLAGPGVSGIGVGPGASTAGTPAATRHGEGLAGVSPTSLPASLPSTRPSMGVGAVAEANLEKPVRVQPSLDKAKASPSQGVGLVSGERAVYAASLPEDVFVEDARSREGDARIEAARVLMESYIAEVGMDALMQQAYPPPSDLQDSCYEILNRCLEANRASIPTSVNNDDLLDFCLKEAAFLGSIEYLLDDEAVTDFTVYRPDMVVIERDGHREVSDYQFTSANTLYIAAQRLLALQGLSTQTAPSFNEIRLGDGTQMQVMLPPAAVTSATICVRKLRRSFYTLNELVSAGVLSTEMEKFLLMSMKARRNILVVGPQGSGRTSLLNALCSEISDGERIATVESGAMMMLPQVSVISLEAQPVQFGQGSDMASLIRQAVRMRAERVIADSLQTGADASAFVQALAGGVQGCMASIMGLRAKDGVDHVARLLSFDGRSAGAGNIGLLLSGIDIVVCMRAYGDKKHRVIEIAELVVNSNADVQLTPLFEFEDGGMGEAASGSGKFRGCGNVAHFYKELERGGVSLDSTIFSN
ncbi:MAG: ATPase, T2SS/T4P/T4SS family [Bradymonadales bacterium]|jgi:pilus assembly protein CpaF